MNREEPSVARERPTPPAARKPLFQRNRTAMKMTALAALTLLLLIPLGMVKGVLGERVERRNAAVRELSASWGARQELIGPVLVVPYRHRSIVRREILVNGNTTFTDEVKLSTAYACFLPRTFHLDGSLDPRTLYRGIYEAVVYRGTLNLSGSFDPPDFEEWPVAPDDIIWDEAYVAVGISDLRGAQDALTLTWNQQPIPLTPTTGLAELPSGVHTRRKGMITPGKSMDFSMTISLSGSEGIRVAPVGEHNEVRLTSPWADPSFKGAMLPSERQVSAGGFEAVWKSSYYGRSYPQKWNSTDSSRIARIDLTASSFGVDLLSLVDHYRLVERAIKYGILFVVLVFTVFFLFEMLGRIRIHPFQYTMVGVALCLFYLTLLSLSEFMPFGFSYASGAAACTLLITLYSATILRNGRRALAVAAELAVIYGILFVILRLQDYSLVLGTAGLFAALAVVMFSTRNIDWYARDEE